MDIFERQLDGVDAATRTQFFGGVADLLGL
jgi:hypothetical protein